MLRVDVLAVHLELEKEWLIVSCTHGTAEEVVHRSTIPTAAADWLARRTAASRPVRLEFKIDANTAAAVHALLPGVTLRSIVGTQIRSGEERLGTLIAGSAQPRRFSKNDVGLLQDCAATIADAVVCSRCRRDSERQTIRTQMALLELAALDKSDFDRVLERLLRTDAEILGVERVGYWSWHSELPGVECEALYHRSRNEYARGITLLARDYPQYFHALREDPVIVAHEARTDPRTSELTDSYLVPAGITSMMDVPVWVHGELAGVVCHEHVGPARRWSMEEREFALSIGHLVSAALEARERKRAEEALRQSEERFRLLMEGVREYAIVMLDAQGRVVSWNAGAERIFGYPAGEIVGRDHSTILAPDETFRREAIDALRTAAERGRAESEGWMARRDGSRFWAHVVVSALRYERGALRGYALLVRDITERRKAEEALRLLSGPLDYQTTLANLARLAVPHLGDVCIIDVLEDDGSIRRRAVATADPSRSDLVQAIERDQPVDTPDATGPAHVIRTGESEMVSDLAEADQRKLPGVERLEPLRALGCASYLCVPLPVRGRILGAMTVLTIGSERKYGPSDRRMVEDFARRAAFAVDNARLYRQAQDAIRMREDVLAIVSHDLRNPLAAIQLNANLLGRLLPEGTDARGRKLVEGILRSTARMERLIRDLLDASRIEAGRLVLERQRHSVVALVQEAVEMLRPLANQHSVRLDMDVPSRPCEVLCDRERILQVLSNLVGNAIKFTPAGGLVTIGIECRPSEVQVSVRDTGIGIPESSLPRLFERYWQARESEHRGAGLGLFIARGIVEAHGGRIWAESKVGQGSVFSFTLPVNNRPAAATMSW